MEATSPVSPSFLCSVAALCWDFCQADSNQIIYIYMVMSLQQQSLVCRGHHVDRLTWLIPHLSANWPDGLKRLHERHRNVRGEGGRTGRGASLMALLTEITKLHLSRAGISTLFTNRSTSDWNVGHCRGPEGKAATPCSKTPTGTHQEEACRDVLSTWWVNTHAAGLHNNLD